MKTIHLIVNYITDGIVEATGGTVNTDLLSEKLIEDPGEAETESPLEEIDKSIEKNIKSKENNITVLDGSENNADENGKVTVEPKERNQE